MMSSIFFCKFDKVSEDHNEANLTEKWIKTEYTKLKNDATEKIYRQKRETIERNARDKKKHEQNKKEQMKQIELANKSQKNKTQATIKREALAKILIEKQSTDWWTELRNYKPSHGPSEELVDLVYTPTAKDIKYTVIRQNEKPLTNIQKKKQSEIMKTYDVVQGLRKAQITNKKKLKLQPSVEITTDLAFVLQENMFVESLLIAYAFAYEVKVIFWMVGKDNKPLYKIEIEKEIEPIKKENMIFDEADPPTVSIEPKDGRPFNRCRIEFKCPFKSYECPINLYYMQMTSMSWSKKSNNLYECQPIYIYEGKSSDKEKFMIRRMEINNTFGFINPKARHFSTISAGDNTSSVENSIEDLPNKEKSELNKDQIEFHIASYAPQDLIFPPKKDIEVIKSVEFDQFIEHQQAKPKSCAEITIKPTEDSKHEEEASESSVDSQNANVDVSQFTVKLQLTFNESCIKNLIIGYQNAYYISAYLSNTTAQVPHAKKGINLTQKVPMSLTDIFGITATLEVDEIAQNQGFNTCEIEIRHTNNMEKSLKLFYVILEKPEETIQKVEPQVKFVDMKKKQSAKQLCQVVQVCLFCKEMIDEKEEERIEIGEILVKGEKLKKCEEHPNQHLKCIRIWQTEHKQDVLCCTVEGCSSII